MKRSLILIMTVLFLLSGCTEKKEETKQALYDLAGKTYYNTVDAYGNEDHSKVWLGRDGSFVMNDNTATGFYEVEGKWSLSENVLTLNASEKAAPSYEKVLFEVKDENTLLLKTSLEGSKSDQVFSTEEVKGSTVKKEEFDLSKIAGSYYNANQPGNARSYLDLKKDGSCELADVGEFAVMAIKGKYMVEDELLGILDHDPKDAFGTDAVFFIIEKDGSLKLDTDLGVSRKGDLFVTADKLPDDGPMGDSLGNFHALYRHEKSDDTSEEYLPNVEFNSAGMFTFTENCYAGMGKYIGWFEKRDDGFTCHVDDASSMKGFAGADVTIIEFEKKDDKTMILKTDLCMSRAGDLFELMP